MGQNDRTYLSRPCPMNMYGRPRPRFLTPDGKALGKPTTNLRKQTMTEFATFWRYIRRVSRLSLFGAVACSVVRHILWMFTTPTSRADVPRALLMVNCFLVLCYLELACLGLLVLSVCLDIYRFRRQSHAEQGNAEQGDVTSAADALPAVEMTGV